jgi:hypothetical protein
MQMNRRVWPWVAGLILAAGLAPDAMAQDRATLGWGRFFYNDLLGDGHDRWQTGGYTVSILRGDRYDGTLPDRPGQILEYRLSANIIAPASLTSPEPGDRRYAGILSLGVHTPFEWRGVELSLGADLVVTGPQTGVGRFQRWAHERLGLDKPLVLGNQIEDGFHPTLVAEAGHSFALAGGRLRPFAELRAGAETLVRVGADLSFGQAGADDLMVRDQTTGQRYHGIAGTLRQGVSLTLGGDVAHVFSSIYLPEGEAATLRADRYRLRAGLSWQGRKSSLFYGLTYLSPEFDQQSEGQLVGGLSLHVKF